MPEENVNVGSGAGAAVDTTTTQPSTQDTQGAAQPQQGGAPGAGAGTGTPGGDADRNWQQMRTNLTDLQKRYEPWEKLGVQPDIAANRLGIYEKVYTQAATIGRNLGYDDDEIIEALQHDPVKTLDYLRQQAQQGQGADDTNQNQDLQALVEQHVQQVVGPIQERENVRMTNEANALFERTVHGLAVQTFKAEGVDVGNIPEDEMFMLTSAVSEILKYDPKALAELKYEGRTGAIQKAFQEAKTYLDKYYLARVGRDRGRVSSPGNGQQAQPGGNGRDAAGRFQPGRSKLDQMIEEPSLINEKYR